MNISDLGIFQDPPKERRILISLNNLNLNSRFYPAPNKEKPAESPSPLSLDEENNHTISDRAQIYKFPISTYTNSSACSKADPHLLHKELKKPDFKQISQIYSQHCKVSDPVPYQFKPKPLPKTYSRPSSAPLSRKSVIQDLIKERESEFKNNCTFKPKINNFTSKRSSELSQQHRVLMLSRPKSEQYEKRERLKREQEEAVLADCTFKPSILRYKGLNASFTEFNAHERLYMEAEAKVFEREKVQRAKEEEYLSHFPFHPQVQNSIYKLVGNKKEQPPIYQRVNEVQQEMLKKKSHIRYLSEINDEDLTFQPKISQNSYQYAHNKKIRSASKSPTGCCSNKYRTNNVSYEDSYTFTPYLTSFTNNSFKTKGKSDFLERQKYYQNRSQARQQAVLSKLEESSYNFTPEIDSTSKYLAECSRYRTAEKLETRLVNEAKKNREMKEDLQEKFYSGFKYEPDINPISKSIGKSSSLSEISNNKFSLALKQKLAEAKAQEDDSKNSFTPKLMASKKFEYVSSSYKQSNELLGTIKKQFKQIQQRREENKKNKEVEEMRECTFTPQGKLGCIYAGDNKVEIKGIDRFFELKSIAKRKEDEQKSREKKLFFENVKSRTEQFTIPQPFNIHPSMKNEKVERVKRELNEKEKGDCAFRPRLIE